MLFRENLDVLFTGTQKIQEIQALIYAGLTNAEENQVLSDAFLRCRACDYISQSGNSLHRMFSVIIIPGNAIVCEKREQLVAVSIKTLRAAYCRRTSVILVHDLAIKPSHRLQELSKEALFQTTMVNFLYDGFQEFAEAFDKILHFLVVRVVQQ